MSDDQDEPCGYRLTVDPTDLHGDIVCPRCGSVWTPQRLLLVALTDPDVVVWASPSDIADALGITDRTLRRWAEGGALAKKAGQYDAGAAFRMHHAGAAC